MFAESDPSLAIGTRMLYQLHPEENYIAPSPLGMVAEIEKWVLPVVDGLHRLMSGYGGASMKIHSVIYRRPRAYWRLPTHMWHGNRFSTS